MQDTILAFYREQSAITRPGKYAAAFTDLPQDIEALNKVEMLCWDAWGMLREKAISEEDARLLDTIADLTGNSDAVFAQLQNCFAQEEYVRLNGSVRNNSPAVRSHDVMLAL